MLLEMNIR